MLRQTGGTRASAFFGQITRFRATPRCLNLITGTYYQASSALSRLVKVCCRGPKEKAPRQNTCIPGGEPTLFGPWLCPGAFCSSQLFVSCLDCEASKNLTLKLSIRKACCAVKRKHSPFFKPMTVDILEQTVNSTDAH